MSRRLAKYYYVSGECECYTPRSITRDNGIPSAVVDLCSRKILLYYS